MNLRVSSFPPIGAPNAKLLILGSMPGQASLDANQYYAHPRNSFWPIMMDIFDAAQDLDYAARTEVLQANRIALWDTLESCERAGSLDAAITAEAVNDFAGFFANHPQITDIFFNGKKAEQVFKRYVLNELESEPYRFHVLPSTSPANASFSYAQKRAAWQVIADSIST